MEAYKEDYLVGSSWRSRWSYTLEDSDKDEIVKQLKNVITDENYDDIITIDLHCDITGDDIEWDITISDYLTIEEWLQCKYEYVEPFRIDGKQYFIGSFESFEIDILNDQGKEV